VEPSSSGRRLYLKDAARRALSGIALLLATGALAPAAMAAPWSRGDCDNVALRGTETPVSAVTLLTIRIVDLGDAEATDDMPEDPERLSESMAPLLFLTPRVTSILEDVFNNGNQEASKTAADAKLDDRPTVKSDGRPTSPVAGTETAPPDVAYGALPLDDGAALPDFQRQMYRTDI
jgi:hypothetical protein